MFTVELLANSAVVCIVTLCFQKQPPEVFYKKSVLGNFTKNSQENTCARVSFLINCRSEAFNFIEKETLVQMFCSEFL